MRRFIRTGGHLNGNAAVLAGLVHGAMKVLSFEHGVLTFEIAGQILKQKTA